MLAFCPFAVGTACHSNTRPVLRKPTASTPSCQVVELPASGVTNWLDPVASGNMVDICGARAGPAAARPLSNRSALSKGLLRCQSWWRAEQERRARAAAGGAPAPRVAAKG